MSRTRSQSGAIAVPLPPPEENRRVLRLCFLGAAVAHVLLLLLPMPGTSGAVAPELPPRVIHRLAPIRPPEPPEPDPVVLPPERTPATTPIPVPDVLVDEWAREQAPLPPADLDALAEAPVILLDAPPPPPAPPEPAADGPVHVIGAVVPPEAVFAPEPQYPEPARRLGRPGTVVLQATIDPEGRVTELEVLRGEPLGMTEAAVAAVRQWRFRPATLEGRPIAVYYHLTVRFQSR